MPEEIYITNSGEETKKLGQQFAQKLGNKDFIAFYGNLGSGKTTFIQGLAQGLGIEKRIISPTFIIIRTYKLKTQNSKLKSTIQNSKLFYHIDLYRTETESDLLGLGIDQIIREENNSIIALEWAEKMGKLLPEKRIDIHFEYVDDSRRKIKIKYI
jgi:tRNA threonylcarbamoyladenosine biosynthesis protein TsaE